MKGQKILQVIILLHPRKNKKNHEPAVPDDALVQAPSALLMEASTGTVIYEKIRYQAKSSEYYKDYDINPDFRC